MRIVCRPLLDWPGQLRTDAQRRPSRFTAGWTDTMQLLEREADMLNAREIVIQLAIPEAQIRLDGWPYAKAQATHPGVTVVLPESSQGRLSWSTDRYSHSSVWKPGGYVRTPGWQANVRAIGLSMEALRAADRHGVMQGRQYAGFRELGSGIPMSDATRHSNMTVEDAARFIAEHVAPEIPHVYRDQVAWARNNGYRLAAKRLHPDAGGDPTAFQRLQEAKQLLDQTHGGVR